MYKIVSVAKEYYIKRHYDSLYKYKFEKYEENERNNVMQNLKNKQEKQVATMFNFVIGHRSSLAALYEALLLLKKK